MEVMLTSAFLDASIGTIFIGITGIVITLVKHSVKLGKIETKLDMMSNNFEKIMEYIAD